MTRALSATVQIAWLNERAVGALVRTPLRIVMPAGPFHFVRAAHHAPGDAR